MQKLRSRTVDKGWHHKKISNELLLRDAFDLDKLKSLKSDLGLIRFVSLNGDRLAYVFTAPAFDRSSVIITYQIWTDCLGAHIARSNPNCAPNTRARDLILSCAKIPMFTTRLEKEASK